MSVALRKVMTPQEFFDGAEARDARYEFDGIQPVPMTGGSLGHSRLIRNVNRQWSSCASTGPCPRSAAT